MIFTSVVSYSTEDNKEPYLEDKKKSFATQLCLHEFYFFYLYDEIELVVKISNNILKKIHDSYFHSRLLPEIQNYILFTKI